MPDRPLWLERPCDPEAHAFRVTDGIHRAACGLVEDPAVLTEPEDEYGPRHLACMIALGAEVAAEMGEMTWRP